MDAWRIRLSGSFAVEDGDGPVAVDGRKSRRLLARLAAAGGALVAGQEIVADLWPRGAPREPARNVAVLVSRMRLGLGADVVLGGRPGYRLGDAVTVDLDEAAALAAEARRRVTAGEPGQAVAAAHRGLELLGDGAVLAGERTADWIDTLHVRVADLQRTLRHTLAAAALDGDDPDTARAAARGAAEADPLDDRAHRLLMRAEHARGEPAAALVVYERLRTALAAELGADPSPATQQVHLAVLRGHAVPARPPVPQRVPRPAPAGRAPELERLTSAWSTSGVALVLVTGEAGIGKTTLAEAAAQRATQTGGVVVAARCHAAERSLLLQPVLDAIAPIVRASPPAQLRRMAGAGSSVLAGLLPDTTALGEPDPARGTPELERRRTFDAVGGFLRSLAATRPVLLLLDDLHNAGMSTVEFVHYLAARPGRDRLLVVATVRTEEGSAILHTLAGVAERVDVGPLPPDAVALLASRAGAPQLAEDILRRTRGHTLFVVETLRALAAGDTGVPDSLQAAVLTRVHRTGPQIERVLRAGAVLGSSMDPEAVARMLDQPPAEVAQQCVLAAEARLLVAAGARYEFANDLVREVLYASTPEPLRIGHHRRAADLLADRPETVAGHASAVGDWARAAQAWLVAGKRAVGRFAAADARSLLDHALDAAHRADVPGLTGRIHLVRARAHEVLGDFTAAEADLRSALVDARRGGDRPVELAALRAHAGDVASALALPERERHLDEALRIAEELVARSAEADLCGWQAVVAANRLRFADAVALGRRAVAAGRTARDPDALAAGLDGLKSAYAYLGEFRSLRPVLEELEPLVRRRGSLQVLFWTIFESSLPAVATADWDTAAGRIDEALAINRQSGMAAHEPWFVAHRGWVERLRGRPDEALTFGRRAVELSVAADHPWWRATSAALLATTLLECGEPAEAVGLLTEVRALVERGGTEAYVLRCLAPLAEATGDLATLRIADAMLTGIQTPVGGAWFAGGDAYLSVARAWLAHDDPTRARAALAPLLTAADRHGWVPWRAAAALVDAAALDALGRPDDAARRITLVRGLAERHDMAHLVAYRSSASRAAARAAPPGSTGR